MLFNCGVGEESWASLGLKEIQPVHPKGDQSWVFIGRNDVEAETPIFWLPDAQTDSFEKTSMLERLKAGGQGDDKGWDGWMASLTQWTWVWVNSGSWWWTERPGLLRFMGSQRVGHDYRLNWTGPIVHGVAKSWTPLSDFHFHMHNRQKVSFQNIFFKP